MTTVHFHIQGRVQGVGFRPHVYRLAKVHGLNGWVSNDLDGVHIQLSGKGKKIQQFREELLAHPPERAIITSWKMEETLEEMYPDFQIVESTHTGRPQVLLTPDLGLCDDCRKELWDAAGRRYHYAFTTCTNCGPRYSIIEALPYDREYTSMYDFCMCPACLAEYFNPEERRHYSQTNSCPACPVHLQWRDQQGSVLTERAHEAISRAVSALNQGKILGVKGIGGYLLLADATNRAVLQLLRARKHRPAKPFALLYPDPAQLEKDVFLTEAELQAWQSVESPIVLLRVRKKPTSGIVVEEIAPGLDRIGVMQPYTPLFALLARTFGRPLVATSANLSGSPIYYKDAAAVKGLSQVADFFLSNDREIVVSQDDSVQRFSEQHDQLICLRRSRGYAPSLLHPSFRNWGADHLAMGAMLKSTFALYTQGNTCLSQCLGNTANFDVQENFQDTLTHFLKLFNVRLQTVAGDLHPDYFSTQLGQTLAKELGVPFRTYQHHEAHFAAVLAEHDLLETKDPLLGIIWDGTGLGRDGQVWGGEYFRFAGEGMDRKSHLDYFDHRFGDKMSLEPRLSALSLLGMEERLRAKFTEKEWAVYATQMDKAGALQTSSVGRLFDGVASLLGLCDKMTFEGEAAMYLEVAADRYLRRNKLPATGYFSGTGTAWKPIMEGILSDLHGGKPTGEIAAKFHLSLVEMIRAVARQENIRKLAFSGGVFQNALLVDLLIGQLQPEFQLYFHRQLSPNDENISFGQLALLYLEETGRLTSGEPDLI